MVTAAAAVTSSAIETNITADLAAGNTASQTELSPAAPRDGFVTLRHTPHFLLFVKFEVMPDMTRVYGSVCRSVITTDSIL